MTLRPEQRADVALKHKVGLLRALDRLGDLRIGGVNEIPDLATELLLPIGQGFDVRIDARIGRVRLHADSISVHRLLQVDLVSRKGALGSMSKRTRACMTVAPVILNRSR